VRVRNPSQPFKGGRGSDQNEKGKVDCFKMKGSLLDITLTTRRWKVVFSHDVILTSGTVPYNLICLVGIVTMIRWQSYSVLRGRNIITIHEAMVCSGVDNKNVPGLTVSVYVLILT
jgi:hypothetical protein